MEWRESGNRVTKAKLQDGFFGFKYFLDNEIIVWLEKRFHYKKVPALAKESRVCVVSLFFLAGRTLCYLCSQGQWGEDKLEGG